MLRNILLGAGVFAALLSVLLFSGKISFGSNEEKPMGEVQLWGTIPETTMSRIVQQFNPEARDYRITYREIPEATFNETIIEAVANGAGPDLIIAPHQVILANSARVYPFPKSSFSEKAFKDTYVDGASVLFTPNGAIALPVSIDPLVLFYNRTLFSKAGFVGPPTYWDEVVNMVQPLTISDQRGGFTQSAIALGAPNVPYAKDILMATVGQLGQVPVIRRYPDGGAPYLSVTANAPAVEGGDVFPLATAARFFSQFADATKNTYTWSQYASRADNVFVAEKLGMYVGQASELATLRARNPKMDIEMSYLPQTRGYNTFVTGGEMYAIATLASSRNLTTAMTVQSQLAGGTYSALIAEGIGATPALRAYAGTPGLPEVVSRSMLVTKLWIDSMPSKSTPLIATLLSDIINGRSVASDAASVFVARLQDLYTPF